METQNKTDGKTSTESVGVTETQVTKDYDEYVFRWGNYIDGLNALMLVKDDKLSNEVFEAKKKIYSLMIRVAKTKFNKEVIS